jgi:hypothetical protein
MSMTRFEPVLRRSAQGATWPLLAGLLAALLLLLGFHQVVRQATQHSELRQKDRVARTHATWRCKGLADSGQRGRCLAQLDFALPDDAVPALQRLAAFDPERP